MPDSNLDIALIPVKTDMSDLLPAHRDFQQRVLDERRRAVLPELRMFTGIPGLIDDLKPGALYRLILPEGKVLQQGKDGLFSGVVYRKGGKISSHAKFEKVPPSIARMASAVGSQVLLVNIAMQLNRVEKAIVGIFDELHRDRIAEIIAGIQQFEIAMHMTNNSHRGAAINHAIQTLTEGFVKVRLELHTRISNLPDTRNRWWENWVGSKTQLAAKEFRLAEESLLVAVRGVSALSECYAVIDEPKAGAEAILRCLQDINSCGIETAAERARLVEVQNRNCLPEYPWKSFCKAHQDFVQRVARTPISPAEVEQGRVEIEFKRSEMQEAT